MRLFLLFLSLISVTMLHAQTTLRVILPLGRTAYQTNEIISVAVARSNPLELPAGKLLLTVRGADGSVAEFTFPVRAAGKATTEHYQLNGALLRPGQYTLLAELDGSSANTQIAVHSHIRQTSFKIIDWASRASGAEQAVLGSLGYNLGFLAYGGLNADALISGGTDFMWNCTMSGGSSMDLRKECDWADPYVVNGGVMRMAKRALMDRNKPNCTGVHIFDEPTLARWKHPETEENTHFNLPVQDKRYKAVFGEDPIAYNKVDANNPQDVAAFMKMLNWRFSLMDAVWKLSEQVVTKVNPDFLTVNQGSWLFSGFGAGYYFNYQRSLPVYSGHGGYNYLYGGIFAPAYFYEFGRMRDYRKPQWYLPTWYASTSDNYRTEQYMSFQQNLQGIAKPPDFLAHRPSRQSAANGLLESNMLMSRLGPIFDNMPVTKPEVAILFSISHPLHNLLENKNDTYYGDGQFNKLKYVYMAAKQLQVPTFPVVEEDILDGSLARDHRVLMLAGTNYLPDTVVAALERFIVAGGQVLISEESKVKIAGSKRFAMPHDFLELADNWDKWGGSGQWAPWNNAWMSSGAYQTAGKLVPILREQFRQIGVKPVFICDQGGIVASRQSRGDVEYIFALNASPNIEQYAWLRGIEARIALPADGRPVYDAVLGGEVPGLTRRGQNLEGAFRFGPGQMRVFARTARPVGGVQLSIPEIDIDLTDAAMPQRLIFSAMLHDHQGKILFAAAALQIRIIDASGDTRYNLYRATDNGVCTLVLPLAANEAAGQWKIIVTELLMYNSSEATFQIADQQQCGAMAGATHRALFLPRERENILQFFRNQRSVTIITGSAPYHQAASARLAAILQPLNVKAVIMPAEEANKPRILTEEEAATWVGLDFGKAQAGEKNSPGKAGFAVHGPVIMLGTPEDNPLVKFMRDQQVLPYAVNRDIPGAGRGMLAWQTDMIGYGQESIACIAYDEVGMAEAIGTLYELASAMDPLTPLALPAAHRFTAGKPTAKIPELQIAWQAQMPDRVDVVKTLLNGDMLVMAHDGTLARITAAGKQSWKRSFNDGDGWALDAADDGHLIVLGSNNRIYGLDGQGRPLFERAFADWRIPPSVSLIAVVPGASRVLVSGGRSFWDPDWHYGGKLLMLDARGNLLWEAGGADPADEKIQLIPQNYLHVVFTRDGGSVFLFSDKGADLRNTLIGSLTSTVAGVTGFVKPLPLDNDLTRYLVEANGHIAEFSLSEARILQQAALPEKVTLAAIANTPGGVVIGTEGDYAVRGLKALNGKVTEQQAWIYPQPTRIVKHLASINNLLAVSYWRGSLEVLIDGKPVAEKTLTQDINNLSWNWKSAKLIVTLADGRVLALNIPEK